jgi:large subunit ribosomal protein L15
MRFMATRLRKSRRQRGSRYCGWGQVGQHRQSGGRGGVGGAGKHKHFWIRTVIEEANHFGHDAFRSLNLNSVRKWINVGQLDSLYARHGSIKENKKALLDLTSLGYDKLLGGGRVQSALSIRIERFSRAAKEKVELSGGEIISNENDTE